MATLPPLDVSIAMSQNAAPQTNSTGASVAPPPPTYQANSAFTWWPYVLIVLGFLGLGGFLYFRRSNG